MSSRSIVSLMTLSLIASACATGPFASKTAPSAVSEPARVALAQQENAVSQELAQKKAQDEIVSRLKTVIASAKKTGPESVDYLADDIYLKASFASMNGDNDTAALLFEHLLELKPNETYLKARYAIELIRTGNIEKPVKVMEDVVASTKHPEERSLLILAGLYAAGNSPKKAQATYARILESNPGNQDACLFMAKSYAMEKNDKKAFQLLDRCEKQSKESGVFSYYKGKLLLSSGKVKDAIKSFDRSLAIDPNYYQAALALGVIHEEKGHWDKAIKVYQRFLDENPGNTVILARMVQAHFAIEKYRDVIPYAERLADLEPDNLNVKVKLGILYSDARDFDKALGVFEDILVQVPDSDKVLYYVGAIYQERGQFDKAVEYFGKIKEDSALYPESTVQIAQILSVMAIEKKDAKEFLSFVQRKSESAAAPKVSLSTVVASYHEMQNETPAAIAALEHVKNEKDFQNPQKYYLASLYEKEKNFTAAESIVWDILKQDMKNAQAWNFLGYSLLERGEKMDRAKEYIEKAVALDPKDGYIRDSLGWYFFKMGQFDRALNELTKARENVKDDHTVSKHLAIVYQKMNRLAEAKVYYVEALKNAKLEDERNEIVKILSDLEPKRLPASRP